MPIDTPILRKIFKAAKLSHWTILEKDIVDEIIFPMTYAGARAMVVMAGNRVGIKVRPHDLRRFLATYVSRSGTPLEIISKLILRHANLWMRPKAEKTSCFNGLR